MKGKKNLHKVQVCSLCGNPGILKWKYNRNKKKPICEACHLARQCIEEKRQGKPMGYFAQIKNGMKEFIEELSEDFWEN